ncbi:MAG: formylglycine-generating enzyme family protein [Polyangiaceae bacterium]
MSTPSFYRSFDGVTTGYTSQANPAEVSDFRLDNYEITVGRFRQFVGVYSKTMTPQGAGANPNNPSDTGWDTAWNNNLEVSAGSLAVALDCSSDYATWTDAANAISQNFPINCLSWFEAEAFCIWDGGRLPTEAEWNYAAAGGTSQRVYPWGSANPSCSYANYYGGSFDKDFCVAPPTGFFSRVGLESPLGDGAYGQADLAGNVSEWVQDWYASTYPTPCINCANLTAASNRGVRSSSFESTKLGLLSSLRSNAPPSTHSSDLGARCARNP